MEYIWRWVYKIWWGLQKNGMTFKVVAWLKQRGVTYAVKRWLLRLRDFSLRKHPNETMKRCREYYDKNRERATRMLSLLSDEKSKKVWGGGSSLSHRPYTLEAGIVF